MHAHTLTRMHMHAHTHAHSHTLTDMHAHAHTLTLSHTHTHIHARTRTHAHTHSHTHSHTHMHTHTYAHAHAHAVFACQLRYILYTVRRVKYTNPKHVLDSFSRAHTWDRRLHRDTERPPTRAPHALPRSIPTGPPREPPFWPPSSTPASPVLELPVRGIVRRSLCVCLRSATTASPRLGHGAVRSSSSPRRVPSQRCLPPFRPWTLGLFLLFSYHERCCHGRPCAGPSVGARGSLLFGITRRRNSWGTR